MLTASSATRYRLITYVGLRFASLHRCSIITQARCYHANLSIYGE